MAFTFNWDLSALVSTPARRRPARPARSAHAPTKTYENKPGSPLPGRCVCNKNSAQAHTCKIFGHYKCGCGKWWRSGNSWYEFSKRKLYTQECKRCNQPVAPHQFNALAIRAEQDDKRGPHDVARCERCRQLGVDCSQLARRY